MVYGTSTDFSELVRLLASKIDEKMKFKTGLIYLRPITDGCLSEFLCSCQRLSEERGTRQGTAPTKKDSFSAQRFSAVATSIRLYIDLCNFVRETAKIL